MCLSPERLCSLAHLTKIVFFSIFAAIMRNAKRILFTLAALLPLLASCSKESLHGDSFSHAMHHHKDTSMRVPTPERRNVLILYSAGYNSISSFLSEDIQDLQKGWLPGPDRGDNVLLVYSHTPAKRGTYSTPNSPSLTRLWQDIDGNPVLDTLVRYPEETYSATAEQLHTVLSYVKDAFPAHSYGMIFSSHATGYLPAGFYTDPYDYTYVGKGAMYRGGYEKRIPQPVPFIEREQDPSLPPVKSIGQDQVGTPGNYLSYEIELGDFVDALPMDMEYILFDACLMGGVEVAYEFKDKCKRIGFSQTEVLAEGFNYQTLTTHLLKSRKPDPKAVCVDYFQQYDVRTDPLYRSATISMVECSRMESLAKVCKELFTKYNSQINSLDYKLVQRYFRSSDHWFYDLEDIIAKAGATEQELDQLHKVLDECIVYKAATPSFMQTFKINTYCGFSMYLPSNGNLELNKYYRTLEWNKATSLVK